MGMIKVLSQEQKDKIIELWNSGYSGGQIAKEIGHTRSAIMGLISRMRQSGKNVEIKRDAVIKPKTRIKTAVKKGRPKKLKIDPSTFQYAFSFQEATQAPNAKPIHFIDLNSFHCRYIINDPKEGALYCGGIKEKRSFCAFHANLCYIPNSSQKKKTATIYYDYG
jgi:hypothetical protein